MGLIYGFAKDLGKYLKWNEDSKLVDNDWLSKSGFKEKATESGYLLRWSLPKKIEARRLDGGGLCLPAPAPDGEAGAAGAGADLA